MLICYFVVVFVFVWDGEGTFCKPYLELLPHNQMLSEVLGRERDKDCKKASLSTWAWKNIRIQENEELEKYKEQDQGQAT